MFHFGPLWSILIYSFQCGPFWTSSVLLVPFSLLRSTSVNFLSFSSFRFTSDHKVHYSPCSSFSSTVVHFGPFNLLQSHSVKDVVSNITLTRSQLCCPWSPRMWKAICNKQTLLPLIYYSLCSVLIHKLIPGRVIRVDVRKACSVLVLLRLFGKLWTIVFWLLKVR